jgi:hypothetical protein
MASIYNNLFIRLGYKLKIATGHDQPCDSAAELPNF